MILMYTSTFGSWKTKSLMTNNKWHFNAYYRLRQYHNVVKKQFPSTCTMFNINYQKYNFAEIKSLLLFQLYRRQVGITVYEWYHLYCIVLKILAVCHKITSNTYPVIYTIFLSFIPCNAIIFIYNKYCNDCSKLEKHNYITPNSTIILKYKFNETFYGHILLIFWFQYEFLKRGMLRIKNK